MPKPLVYCLLLLAPLVLGAAAPARTGEQMEISAKNTTFDGKAHTYEVTGDVHITLPKLEVTCRRATVYADPTDARIVRITFDGDVEAKKGTDTFRAERITYYVIERRLVAEGATKTRLKLPLEASGAPAGP